MTYVCGGAKLALNPLFLIKNPGVAGFMGSFLWALH